MAAGISAPELEIGERIQTDSVNSLRFNSFNIIYSIKERIFTIGRYPFGKIFCRQSVL